jgi:hypothetical protein
MATHVLDVSTAGNPVKALADALIELGLEPGGVYRTGVAHDDGCPCLTGAGLRRCTCEIVRITQERVR